MEYYIEQGLNNPDDFESARQEIEWAENKYLKEHGWVHTSDSPGCIWLWAKQWQGKILMVPRAIAISMQSSGMMRHVELPPGINGHEGAVGEPGIDSETTD